MKNITKTAMVSTTVVLILVAAVLANAPAAVRENTNMPAMVGMMSDMEGLHQNMERMHNECQEHMGGMMGMTTAQHEEHHTSKP